MNDENMILIDDFMEPFTEEERRVKHFCWECLNFIFSKVPNRFHIILFTHTEYIYEPDKVPEVYASSFHYTLDDGSNRFGDQNEYRRLFVYMDKIIPDLRYHDYTSFIDATFLFYIITHEVMHSFTFTDYKLEMDWYDNNREAYNSYYNSIELLNDIKTRDFIMRYKSEIEETLGFQIIDYVIKDCVNETRKTVNDPFIFG